MATFCGLWIGAMRRRRRRRTVVHGCVCPRGRREWVLWESLLGEIVRLKLLPAAVLGGRKGRGSARKHQLH